MCVSGIQNRYLYTSFIHQMAFDTSHKYHEMLMQLVPFHGSVHKGKIPRVNIDKELPMSNPFKCSVEHDTKLFYLLSP